MTRKKKPEPELLPTNEDVIVTLQGAVASALDAVRAGQQYLGEVEDAFDARQWEFEWGQLDAAEACLLGLQSHVDALEP